MGYFDPEEGIFWQQTGAGSAMVRRSSTSGSPVDEVVAQVNWNLDPMDGTGPSGITLDPTKTQILIIDLQWLGVGRVRVGFVIGGAIYYVHEFLYANVLSTVYMRTATLPVRYEITNTGVAASATNDLIQICSAVMSEGGLDFVPQRRFTANNGTTLINLTTRRPILSIRPRLTFNSQTNRIPISVESLEFYIDAATNAFVEVVFGGALTGAAFADVDTANSAAQFDVAATAITGGTIVASAYVTGAARGITRAVPPRTPLTLDAAGVVQTPLSVVATRIGGGATNVAAALDWLEMR
jgi:hypothetical protein